MRRIGTLDYATFLAQTAKVDTVRLEVKDGSYLRGYLHVADDKGDARLTLEVPGFGQRSHFKIEAILRDGGKYDRREAMGSPAVLSLRTRRVWLEANVGRLVVVDMVEQVTYVGGKGFAQTATIDLGYGQKVILEAPERPEGEFRIKVLDERRENTLLDQFEVPVLSESEVRTKITDRVLDTISSGLVAEQLPVLRDAIHRVASPFWPYVRHRR